MNRLCTALILTLLLSPISATAQDREIAGIRFADQIDVGSHRLQLNGAGLRTRFFFKVYAMGLYLQSGGMDPAQAIAAEGAKRAHIVTLRELTADQFADALVEGVRNNHTAAQWSALEARVGVLGKTIRSLESASEGMVVQLDYLPDRGTVLIIDGEEKGDAIAGADFYAALLRVWLGENPADGDLKRALGAAPG